MGAVRTTFAMVAASLVRRKQLIARGIADPYAGKLTGSMSPSSSAVGPGMNSVSTTVNRFLPSLKLAGLKIANKLGNCHL